MLNIKTGRAAAATRLDAIHSGTSRIVLALTISAASLSAQAKAPEQPFDRIIVFGDSISDSGTYATKAPVGAGKFTTNPDPVWVEVIAAGLSLDLKPHVEGGSNYAEGGARVAIERPNAPGALSRRPVAAQVNDFLANDGLLTPQSLVIIQGGGNDVFATKLNGPTDTPDDLEVLRVAAEGLADNIGKLIDAGAGTVVTTSVPKFEQYNERYDAALASRGFNVLYFDMAGLVAEIETNPAEFGILNVTDRACRGSALESFVCLPKDYVTPDANRTYLYADSVHFTGVVHEIQGDAILASLRAPGQIALLPYMIRSSIRANNQLAWDRAARTSVSEGGWSIIGGIKASRIELPGFAFNNEGDAETFGFQIGAERAVTPKLTTGAYFSWGSGNGNFAANSGGVDTQTYGIDAYATYRQGPVGFSVLASVGSADLDDIHRRVPLGPAERIETGSSEGDFITLEARVEADVARGPIKLTPFAAARYDSVGIDGYAEEGGRSTQISVGDQRLKTLELSAGLRLSPGAPVKGFMPAIEFGYAGDVLDEPHRVSILPHGAPVWFTTDAYKLMDDAYFYGLSVAGTLGNRSTLTLGVRGRSGEDHDEFSGAISLAFRF